VSTVFNDVQSALDARLASMSGSLDIAFPNIPYEPAANESYLRANFLPADVVQAALGASGKDRIDGVYQVDVFTVAGTGRTNIPDTIADHFKRGTNLTYNSNTVRIINVSINPAIISGSWQAVPVSINFYSYMTAR